MKLPQILFLLTLLLISSQTGFGQEYKEDENWIDGGAFPYLIHNFKNYTKEDVINAKEKLNLIKQSKIDNEWEGSYIVPGDMRDTKLFWNPAVGFVNYYIYTCAIELRALNYGKVINNTDSLILVTEKSLPPFYQTGKTGQIKLIKVKWGDLHFLVEEDEIELFCELAAGYYGLAKMETVEINGESYQNPKSIWDSFWVKSSEMTEKKPFGLPILPKAYERFIKQPIETRIIALGKYEKDAPTEEPVITYSRRYINIGAGKNLGIKIGMEFYVPDLGERISVIEVKNKSAVGVLERMIDSKTREENCLNHTGAEIPCRNPKTGMKLKTIPNDLLEDN